MLAEQILNVRTMIESRAWPEVRGVIKTLPEPEIAELLFEVDTHDRMILFRLLPRDVSTEVFAQLEAEEQNLLLEELSTEETRHLLAELSPDDRTQIFEELPGRVTQKLLNLLNPSDLKETRKLLGYPPESVGRLMTPDYVAVRPDWTIRHALDHVRVKGHKSETVNVLYVTDKAWRLLDALDLTRFILTNPDQTVESIMDHSFVALEVSQDREEAVRTMERYDLAVLPVVDRDNVLVGIVTFDDVMDVAQAEVTEDFHKSAAVAPIKGSYRDATFRALYTKRIGWLLALVFTNLLSGGVLASFEEIISMHVALVFFLPLLIGSSGNAGSQSATLMVRALAMGDVEMKDWWRLLIKEVLIAAALGITMALAVSAIGLWRGGPGIAVTVGLTMTAVVIVGSLIGMVLPFILSRLNLDPATASAPLVTSMADIAGVVVYLTLATLILQRLV